MFFLSLQSERKEHNIHNNKEGNNNKEGMLCFNMYNRVKAPNDSSDGSNTLNDGVKGTAGSELPLFGFSVVAIATNNFSDANKLGEGGFGIVYKVAFLCLFKWKILKVDS